MAYSERYQSNLVFSANTDQAKKAIESLQNQFNMLLKASSNFNLGSQISQDMVQAQKAVAELQVSLNKAFNSTTGKLDLSSFSTSLKNSGRTLQEYQTILNSMGPAGQKAFSNLAYQIQQAEIPLRRTGKLADELWTTLKNTARWQLSASLLQGFTGAIQKAYRYSQDLNKSLNDIRIVTGQSVEDMSRFAVEANKTAKALSATTNEYAKASLIYFQQGLSDAEVKERTDVTIKMANVSRESAETVSDQMTAVWNNFADGSKTLEYYADVMTALGAATASSTAEITTGLEKFAAVAETVGLSYEYATTALATITDTTRQSADVVGNALKTLFARIQGLSLGETLEDGTDLTKYSEALMKVGISIKEQDGSLREMDDILDDMASKWQTLSKDQQVALAQTVAGVRQYTQLVALMDNWDKFEMNLEVAEGAEGTLQEQADIYAESWEAARDRVQASAETIYSTLLNDEFFIDLTNMFSGLLDGVSNLSKGLGGLPGVLALVGTAFTKILDQKLISGINNLVYNLGRGKDQLKALQSQASELLINNQPQNIQGTLMADAYKQQGILQQELLAKQDELTQEQREQYAILQQIHKQKADSLIQTGQEIELLEKELKTLEKQVMYRSSASAKQGARATFNGTWNNQKNAINVWQKVASSDYDIATGGNVDKLKQIVNELSKDLPKMSDKATKAFQKLQAELEKNQINAEELANAFLEFESQSLNVGNLDRALRNLGYSEEEANALAHRLVDTYNNLNYEMDEGKAKTQDLEEYTKRLTKALKEQNGTVITFGQGFAASVQAIGSFATALSSIRGLIDIWKNDSLSDWEKWLTLLTQIGFILPMIITSGQQLAKTFSAANIIATMAKGNKDAITEMTAAIVGSTVAKEGENAVTLKQLITYKLSQTATYKYIAAKLAEKTAISGAAAANLALMGSMLPYIAVIGAIVGVIALAVGAWKKWKAAQPEAQLEKATETANNLANALSDVKTQAEELNEAFDKYDTAQKALEDCVEGTEEWEQALKDANAAALELLRNHPELYGTGGVSNENGRIVISDKAKEQVQQTYSNRETILTGADASAQAAKREANINNIWSSFGDIVSGSVWDASGDESALFSRLNTIKQQNGTITEYDLQKLQSENNPIWGDELNNVYDELVIAVNSLNNAIIENTLATEIETGNAVRELVGDNYSDAVVKGLSNTYLEKVDSEKAAYTNKEDDDLFRTYANLMGLSGASYDAKEQQYTLNGETYDLTRDAMIEALAVNSAKEDIKTDAIQLSSLLGDDNTVQSRLVNEGTSALSKVEMAQMDANVLAQMVDLGAITQQIADEINAIPDDVIGSTNLEDTLSANLQQTFKTVFGEDWSTGEIGDIIQRVPVDMRGAFANAVSQTDWSDIDSAQGFKDLLHELGGWLPDDTLERFVQQMIDANDATKNFSLEEFRKEYSTTNEILDKLKNGDTISPEDFAALGEEYAHYFGLMEDGSYALIGDAEQFYNLVSKNSLNDLKESLSARQNNMADYESAGMTTDLNIDRLQRDELSQMSSDLGLEAHNVSAKQMRENLKAAQEEYKALVAVQEEEGAALLATAKSEEEIIALTKEFNISANASEKAIKTFTANLSKAQKELKATASGLSKSAPELESVMEILSSSPDDQIALTESITAAIKAFPELSGSIMTAYDALMAATPGTKEYAIALQDLYNIISTNSALQILEDNGEAARQAVDVLDNSKSTSVEIENAINNLNSLFGAEIFTSADIGTEKLDNLKRALEGDAEAFKTLQASVAEGIMIKYGMTTGQIDLSALMSSGVDIKTMSAEIRDALIACGAFEIVEEEMEVPDPSVIGDVIDGVEITKANFETMALAYGLTKKVKVQKIKAIDAPSGADSFGGGGYSGDTGGGSGGGSSKPSTKTYEEDKFHIEKKAVASLEKDLERLEKKREHAFGEDKRSFLDSEIEKTKELQGEYAKYQVAVQAELATAKTEAINVGAQIDPTSGAILNYNKLMEQFTLEYNAAMAKAGDNDAAQEAAEKRYDTLVKTLETYYELYDLNEELIDTIYDLDLSVHSKELETISLYVEQVFDVTDDELKYIDWMMTKIENRAFSTAQQLTQLLKQTEPLLTQGNSLQYAFGEIDKMISQAGWTDEIGELGDNTVDNAYSVMEALLNLKNNAMDKVTEGIDEQSSAFDQWIARWDNFRTIVSNMDDIFGLLGEKFVTPEMEATLDETDSQLALDNLKGTKSDLDYWTSVRDSAKEQRDAFAEGTEEYEKWDKIYRDALVEQEKCQADLTAAWKETLEAITTQYENSVDRAIAEAEKGITGFKSLEEAQKALDQQMKDKELFLEDFERAHELSNLTYDINKAMNDLSNSVAKNNMAKLLDDIAEYEKEGVKMTEYELEVLQKKFEIEQARADLEAAKTAMSQVRLTRDDEGNWSYQYTADQDKIDEATRSFEDKMYELEKLSREHIDETTATILELEQEMFEEIKNLNIKDFKDVDEFNAAKQKIIQTYTTRVKELYGDIGLAIETVNGIYGTEEITFAQTTAGITSGAKSQDEAIQNFKDSTVTASGAITDAAKTYQAQVEETFPAVGTTVEGFSEDYNEYMDGMTEKSKTLVEEVEGMSDKYSTAIGQIMIEVRQWQQDFGDEIDLMIQKLEELISKYNEAKAAKMNVGDGGGPETITEEAPETETEDTQTDNASSTEAEAANMASDAEELLRRVHTANLGGYKADGSAGGWKNYARSEGYSEEVISLVFKALNDSKAGGGYSYFYGKAKELLGLASGGYTGEWGPEGRLALLHQKELVLNPQDTENFLAGINILREITRMIDLQANAMASPMGFAMPFASHGGSGLEQNVHISASFPGVQDRNEIEIALRSLVNEASQFVLE